MAATRTLSLIHVVLGGVLATGAIPAAARACTPGECRQPHVWPAAGSLPSNAVAFVWLPPRRSDLSTAPIHLYELKDGLRRELETKSLVGDGLVTVAPAERVAEGMDLVFDAEPTPCPDAIDLASSAVRVTAAAALPMLLGTLRAAAPYASTTTVNGNAGACTQTWSSVNVGLTLQLAPEALPYADGLRHAILVDGVEQARYADLEVTRPAQASKEPSAQPQDMLFALCAGPTATGTAALAEGEHRVQWLARTSAGVTLYSDEIRVALRCEDVWGPLPENAAVATADAGGPLVVDVFCKYDERGRVAEGSDPWCEEKLTTENHGCAIAAPSQRRSFAGALAALALTVGLLVRRRAGPRR